MANKPQPTSISRNESRSRTAEEARPIRRRNRGTGLTADWANVDRDKLVDAVVAVSGHKCAIQFGYTSDGGSFVIRIVGDGDPYNEYVRPTEDINLVLESIALDFRK